MQQYHWTDSRRGLSLQEICDHLIAHGLRYSPVRVHSMHELEECFPAVVQLRVAANEVGHFVVVEGRTRGDQYSIWDGRRGRYPLSASELDSKATGLAAIEENSLEVSPNVWNVWPVILLFISTELILAHHRLSRQTER